MFTRPTSFGASVSLERAPTESEQAESQEQHGRWFGHNCRVGA